MADIKYLIEVDEKGAVTKIKEVDSAITGLKGSSDKAGTAFSGMWKQFVGGQLVLDGLKKGFGALKGFITSSIDEAKQAEVAEHNLATALDLTGRSRNAMLPGLITFTQEIQNTTKFTQEDAQASLTLLTQLTNLDSKGLKAATKGAVGLASVMGIDLNSATMLVTKAMGGNYTALSRYGIKIDETLPKEQQRTQLLEKLSVFYGRATAETETFSGRVTQLSKAWDDVKESVGKAITENETIKRIIGDITKKLTDLVESGAIEEWATKALNTIMKLVDGIKLAKDVIMELHEGLLGIASAFAGAASGATAEINKKIGEAKEKAIEFKLSLKVLKPSLEEIRTESEKGAASWADYVARMKTMDDQLVKNKGTVEGWIDKGLKFLGIHTALPPKINETGNALGGAAEKTKTLAEQLGIVTRIELETKLNLYKTALDKYKDTIDLTTKAKEDLRKKIKDLEIELGIYKGYLSDIKNELMTGVIPSTRGFKTELEGLPENLKNLGTEGKSSMEIVGDSAEEVTTNTKNYFADMYLNITSGWGNTIQTWLSGATTFKDFMKGIWGDIKNSFFRVIGEMAAEWAVGLLKDMVKTAKDAAAGVTSSFANMGSGIAGIATSIGTIITTLATAVATAIATIATGIGTALVTLATAIASAATILAAAAAAIITVGALAVALYAAFKIVGGIIDKLFGSGGKSGDVTYWLKMIWENTQNLWNTMTWLPNVFNTMTQQLDTLKTIGWDLKPALVSRFDKANAYLKQILDAIRGLPQAQGGGYFERPALVHVAERGPEWVLNRQQITNIMHAAPTAGSSSSMNLSLTFNINAINREGMKEEVQQRILPIIIDTIKTNTRQLGRKLNMAQGIA